MSSEETDRGHCSLWLPTASWYMNLSLYLSSEPYEEGVPAAREKAVPARERLDRYGLVFPVGSELNSSFLAYGKQKRFRQALSLLSVTNGSHGVSTAAQCYVLFICIRIDH